jgi:hypothetical protein
MQNDETAIAQAIERLKSRQPKQRGRRAAVAPFAEQLRELISQGWTRSEIVGEIKMLGGHMSPALLRDVLGIPPKPKRPKKSSS